MKRTMQLTAGLTAVMLIGSAAQAITLFEGNYDVSNWTLATNGGDGSVDTTNAPNSITLFGSDTGTEDAINTDFTVSVLDNGAFVFDWDYETVDVEGPFFDPFGYLLNGAFFQLTNNVGPIIQSGQTSVPVLIGDVFGFRVHSGDDQFGRAWATISDAGSFADPTDPSDPTVIPEPTTVALGMLALAGLAGTIARRRHAAA